MKKIIVIGGGPAGIMAAIRAAQLGGQVLLLEKNDRLGKKLLLTGKGRCNLTNACGLDEFLKRVGRNGPFLRDAFKRFFNQALMNFFEERGVALKVERQERVFPKSDHAQSILHALEKTLAELKVEVRLRTPVDAVLLAGEAAGGVRTRDGQKIHGDAVVLATGGLSYPRTGSTGDGLKMARSSGHQVVEPRPALVGLKTVESFPGRLEGLTLKNIVLTFSEGRKKVRSEVGELLFTGKGISGPLVLSWSGTVGDWLADGKKVAVDIDLKPGLSEQDLDQRLLREFKAGARSLLKNILKNLLPMRLIEVFLEGCGLDPNQKANQISQEGRRRIIRLLKHFSVEAAACEPFDQAMVTRGGVSVKDINPKTMESRLVRNLFFAGELVDVDADTGGFNLQAAFSTGYLAGESAAAQETAM